MSDIYYWRAWVKRNRPRYNEKQRQWIAERRFQAHLYEALRGERCPDFDALLRPRKHRNQRNAHPDLAPCASMPAAEVMLRPTSNSAG